MRAVRGFLRRREADVDEPRRSQAWRDLVDRVLVGLNALDLYGLEPGTEDGAPWGEHEPEAVPMTTATTTTASGRVSGGTVNPCPPTSA
ncbi:hypothetical protein IFT79_12160 [Frigoribacterium sp. CFBP 8759]|uniref:hypothetical protein n=1 Tax=Frigoribacterium sp. CFBP 8759 TaxID=2775283 RepID=UPI00177B38DD|nr:hypothetical protein [Frigoribacterium sp. CFBP 8759]MBD8486372.1 hypothetical protein [Frigoribacterium sp. CFBP 8759]